MLEECTLHESDKSADDVLKVNSDTSYIDSEAEAMFLEGDITLDK